MHRRILVPIDGSPTSKLGLKEAMGLAKREGARLRVLNVLDEKLHVPGVDAYGAADPVLFVSGEPSQNQPVKKSVRKRR